MVDLGKLRRALAEQGIDVIVASSGENIFYTSNFPCIPSVKNRGVFNQSRISEAIFAVIGAKEKETLICTIGLYGIAENSSTIRDIRFSGTGMHLVYEPGTERQVFQNDPKDGLVEVLREHGSLKKVAIEAGFVSANLYQKLVAAFPGVEFVDAKPIFSKLREIKSPEEIKRLRQSVAVAVEGVKAFTKLIAEGVSEHELLQAYKDVLLKKGCDWGTTTLGGGAGSGEPYNIAGEYRLRRGDVIRFDGGAIYKGYFSDISRCFAVGEIPERARKIYDAIFRAQQGILERMKPGVKFGDLFDYGMQVVWDAGFPEYRRGNLGHGFGLVVHEPPLIAHGNEQLVEPGMTLAIEAPFYVDNFAGFNAENNVLVTEDGVELLDPDLDIDFKVL